MIYKLQKIERDVKVCIDQNTVSDQLLGAGDIDTLSLDEIIRSKIPDAVKTVHCTAPAHLLEGGHNFGDAVYWGEQESGWVLLPNDFMRLIAFEMSDWERCVTEAITPADPQYSLQRQRVKALRGNAQKPVCAIVNRPEGRALEFYSCKRKDAYVSRGQYLPYPEIDEYGGVDISELCYPAVIYTTAAMVLLTLGEVERSTLLDNVSKSLLQ